MKPIILLYNPEQQKLFDIVLQGLKINFVNYGSVNAKVLKPNQPIPLKTVFTPNAIFFKECSSYFSDIEPYAFKEKLEIIDDNLIKTIHSPQLVFIINKTVFNPDFKQSIFRNFDCITID